MFKALLILIIIVASYGAFHTFFLNVATNRQGVANSKVYSTKEMEGKWVNQDSQSNDFILINSDNTFSSNLIKQYPDLGKETVGHGNWELKKGTVQTNIVLRYDDGSDAGMTLGMRIEEKEGKIKICVGENKFNKITE